MKTIRETIQKNPAAYADGYHLVCHSQGGLSCRQVIQEMDDHKIDTFISMAGPQMGVYGEYSVMKYMWPSVLLPNLWRLLYNPVLQNMLSVANMWHDPNVENNFIVNTNFIPELNNLRLHDNSARYRNNFLRVQKAVFFGSDGDEVIQPWYSSQFEYYAPDHKTRVPREQQTVYAKDLTGVRTLAEQGRALFPKVDGMGHDSWISDEHLFLSQIEQHLI
eukprot:GFYU01007811.1.p1 GENE.GFYU01007811.1~~GFYU01007811.1.p1  ORF type:complete len:219 (+),score=69.07 GFYU01007811.1:2-658(+)